NIPFKPLIYQGFCLPLCKICAKKIQEGFSALRRISNFVYNKITNTKGKKKMGINKIRSTLYKPAKIFGDVNAVKNGTIGKCIARHLVGLFRIDKRTHVPYDWFTEEAIT
ncbi:hypothetical protein, partial [Bacillus licheniformis]